MNLYQEIVKIVLEYASRERKIYYGEEVYCFNFNINTRIDGGLANVASDD